MANLIESLFRVDPTEGLVQYAKVVKPYHTKILDVLVEYIYTEKASVTINEKWEWTLQLGEPDADVIRMCGYGLVWDAFRSNETNPSTTIISAESNTSLGVPSNTFLIEPSLGSPYTVLVTNLQSNQLTFVRPYVTVGVNPALKKWTAQGNLSSNLSVGQKIYIRENSGFGADKEYTVVSFTLVLGNTEITVQESISIQAASDGTLYVPMLLSDIPTWATGLELQLSTVGSYPNPISPTARYYFAPTSTPGVFNLATKRYPTLLTDYVDVTTVGSGQLLAHRSETFFPGSTVIVTGSYLNKNDGTYIVLKTEPEGIYTRVYVLQKVPYTTPSPLTTDGIITAAVQGYDDPSYCAVAQSPGLYADTFIHESIKFEFHIDFTETLQTNISQDTIDGFGYVPYSLGPYALFGNGSFGHNYSTAPTSGRMNISATHTILPHGFDIQLFDIGSMVETIDSVAKNYGNTI